MRTGAVHYIVLYCAVAEWVRLAWADWSPLLPGQQPGCLASLAASPMVMALNPARDLSLTLGPVEKEAAWHHRAE